MIASEMTPFVRCCVYVTANADKVFFLRCDCYLTLFTYLFIWGYAYCVHFAKTTYHIILELKLTTLLKSSWRVKRENFYKTFLFLNKKVIAFINQDGTLTVSLFLKKIFKKTKIAQEIFLSSFTLKTNLAIFRTLIYLTGH